MTDTSPSTSGLPAPPGGGSQVPDRVVTPEDRDAAVERLSAAYAGDVLPVEEFERRVALVYRAATADSLDGLTRDLPAHPTEPADATAVAPAGLPAERITATLSSVERSGHSVIPTHLEIRSIAGNIELDLREAEFEPGLTHIQVFNVLGNVEVRLPADVAVENRGGAFLGSFAARTTRAEDREEPPVSTVRIAGRAILGNVEFNSGARRRGA